MATEVYEKIFISCFLRQELLYWSILGYLWEKADTESIRRGGSLSRKRGPGGGLEE